MAQAHMRRHMNEIDDERETLKNHCRYARYTQRTHRTQCVRMRLLLT